MNEISTPDSFKSKKKARSSGVLELPSGNTVRVRRPSMEKFLSSGFLPDPLAREITNMISTKSGRGSVGGKQKEDLAEIMFEKMGGLAGMSAMMRVTDKLAAYCIVEPKTFWHERVVGKDKDGNDVFEDIPDSERDGECLYTDDIEMDDKVFLFQYCTGGSTDLSQFRSPADSPLAVVLPSGEVVETAEPNPVHQKLV